MMQDGPDVPATLIADLYDTACEADGLGQLAERVAAHVGVRGAALLLVRGEVAPESYSSDIIREQTHLYQTYYHRLDPWRNRGLLPGRDRVVLANELYPEDELVKTEFYADFARPMGMFRPMSAYIDLGPGEMAALGVEEPFSKRLFEVEDKQRLLAIMPYMKRALQLRLRLNAAGRAANLGFRALDGLAIGVVICSAGGHVGYANAAAREIAASGHGLKLDSQAGTIGARAPREAARLGQLIQEAAAGRGGGLRLTGRDGTAAAALVTPVPDGLDASASGQVMVTLRAEGAVPGPSPTLLRSLYGLSPAQAALCASLSAGKTFEEIASERGVAVTTMRTHLAAILARTDTRNLRDLLRLLGSLPAVR